MSQGTSFHDSSSTTSPSYDFVARPKNQLPPVNPTFAGRPGGAEAAAPLAQAFVPDKPPGLSATQKVLVAVPLLAITAVLAVVVGGFGLRAYRDHQRQAQIAHTSVAFPASIAGMTRRTAAQPQADKFVTQVPTPTPPQGAAYGTGKTRVGLVFAAAYAMTDDEQGDYLQSAQQIARQQGFQLVEVDSGGLGGHLWCGANAHKAQTFCAFADVAAYGAMVVPGVGNQGQATASTFRTAVEHRS